MTQGPSSEPDRTSIDFTRIRDSHGRVVRKATLYRISDVSGWNIGMEIFYPGWSVLWHSSDSPNKHRNNFSTKAIRPRPTPYTSSPGHFFTNDPITLRCIAWVINSIVKWTINTYTSLLRLEHALLVLVIDTSYEAFRVAQQWLAYWPSNWLTDCLAGWLGDWLTDNDWLAQWLTNWLADWLTMTEGLKLSSWLAHWVQLTGWLGDWLTDCQWLAGTMTDWLTG